MFFQNKIDRAMKRLHENSDAGKAEREEAEGMQQYEAPELEKNDVLAMVIAAAITMFLWHCSYYLDWEQSFILH